MKIKITEIKKNATLPTDQTIKIYLGQNYSIFPGDIREVSTGLTFEVPNGHTMLIEPLWNGLLWITKGMILKSGWKGELKLTIVNLGKGTLVLKPNDPIAEAHLVKSAPIEFIKEEPISEDNQ